MKKWLIFRPLGIKKKNLCPFKQMLGDQSKILPSNDYIPLDLRTVSELSSRKSISWQGPCSCWAVSQWVSSSRLLWFEALIVNSQSRQVYGPG